MEQYKPYFYTNLVSLLDYADGGYVIFDEPSRTSEHIRSFLNDFQESYKGGSWRRGPPAARHCRQLP